MNVGKSSALEKRGWRWHRKKKSSLNKRVPKTDWYNEIPVAEKWDKMSEGERRKWLSEIPEHNFGAGGLEAAVKATWKKMKLFSLSKNMLRVRIQKKFGISGTKPGMQEAFGRALGLQSAKEGSSVTKYNKMTREVWNRMSHNEREKILDRISTGRRFAYSSWGELPKSIIHEMKWELWHETNPFKPMPKNASAAKGGKTHWPSDDFPEDWEDGKWQKPPSQIVPRKRKSKQDVKKFGLYDAHFRLLGDISHYMSEKDMKYQLTQQFGVTPAKANELFKAWKEGAGHTVKAYDDPWKWKPERFGEFWNASDPGSKTIIMRTARVNSRYWNNLFTKRWSALPGPMQEKIRSGILIAQSENPTFKILLRRSLAGKIQPAASQEAFQGDKFKKLKPDEYKKIWDNPAFRQQRWIIVEDSKMVSHHGIGAQEQKVIAQRNWDQQDRFEKRDLQVRMMFR